SNGANDGWDHAVDAEAALEHEQHQHDRRGQANEEVVARPGLGPHRRRLLRLAHRLLPTARSRSRRSRTTGTDSSLAAHTTGTPILANWRRRRSWAWWYRSAVRRRSCGLGS